MSHRIKKIFDNLTVWQMNGKRAPHKPLMILIALGRLQNKSYQFSYEEIEGQLIDLLIKYGPQRNAYKADEPFWRLGRNEGIFELINSEKCPVHKDGGTSRTALIKYNVSARFSSEIIDYFNEDPSEIIQVATDLVINHFQISYLDDLFYEVGLIHDNVSIALKRRDPAFRVSVIAAYEDRCAICGFHMLLNRRPIGLEAAHIKWHKAGGPDSENNGLALCTTHHKLFDYGAFFIEPGSYKIKISNSLSCFNAAESYVAKYHDVKIRLPNESLFYPNSAYLQWHINEIFKGMPR